MAAPARYAMAMPSPVATVGLVVRAYTWPAPPVARIVTMATLRVELSVVEVHREGARRSARPA